MMSQFAASAQAGTNTQVSHPHHTDLRSGGESDCHGNQAGEVKLEQLLTIGNMKPTKYRAFCICCKDHLVWSGQHEVEVLGEPRRY